MTTADTVEIKLKSTWEMAAEDILTVLMAEPLAFNRAAFDSGLLSEHFPPGDLRIMYHTISGLRLENLDENDNPKPINDTMIVHRCKEKVSERTVNEIRRMYDPERSGLFQANLNILMELGKAESAVGRMDEGKRRIIAGEPVEKVIGWLMGEMEMEVGQDIADCTATAALQRFNVMMAAGPAKTYATGIPIIDDLMGGIMRKFLMWLVGMYKGGKSSAMRSAILGALRSGASVTLLTLEGYQEMIVAQFIAMLMAEYLLENELYFETRQQGEDRVFLRDVSSLSIILAGNAYEQLWFPEQIAARRWAEAEFAKFGKRLRIYDPRSKYGRVSDLPSLQRLLLKDKYQYGSDIGAVDYLGRIKRTAGQSYFDLTDDAALSLQDTALAHDLAIIILAQQSEEAIKNNNTGKGAGTPGVKGGGTPAATADGLWMVGGDDDMPYNPNDPLFRMELRLSRYAPSSKKGHTEEAYYHIHAPSGYIIPERFVDKYWRHIDLSSF